MQAKPAPRDKSFVRLRTRRRGNDRNGPVQNKDEQTVAVRQGPTKPTPPVYLPHSLGMSTQCRLQSYTRQGDRRCGWRRRRPADRVANCQIGEAVRLPSGRRTIVKSCSVRAVRASFHGMPPGRDNDRMGWGV